MTMSQKRKRIEYWKKVQLTSWAEFELFPKQVQEDGPLWVERVQAIKDAGFDYCIIETEETIIVSKPELVFK